jgi:nitrogen fixation protein FixH
MPPAGSSERLFAHRCGHPRTTVENQSTITGTGTHTNSQALVGEWDAKFSAVDGEFAIYRVVIREVVGHYCLVSELPLE